MNRQRRICLWLVPLLVVLYGCKKTIDDYPLANLRAISSFNFDYYHNSDCKIFVQAEGTIDETNRSIEVHVPMDADLTRLRPTITLSPWTICSPKNLEMVDFSAGVVEYEVTAQSGKKAYYTVSVIPDFIYQDAAMIRLVLSDIPASPGADSDADDKSAGLSGVPDKESDGAVVNITLPTGWSSKYDMSAQRTHLDMSASSHHCKIEVDDSGTDETSYRTFEDMDEVDYTHSVIFRITSQSGKVVRYTVTIQESETV